MHQFEKFLEEDKQKNNFVNDLFVELRGVQNLLPQLFNASEATRASIEFHETTDALNRVCDAIIKKLSQLEDIVSALKIDKQEQ